MQKKNPQEMTDLLQLEAAALKVDVFVMHYSSSWYFADLNVIAVA